MSRGLNRLAGVVAAALISTALLSAGETLTGDTNRPELSVYIPGEKVELTFKAAGLDPQAKDLKLAVNIVDEREKAIKALELPVTPDAQGAWSVTVPAPADRLGFYRVRAKLSEGTTIPAIGGKGDRPEGFISYAVVVDPAQRRLYPSADTVFGMQGGFNRKIQVLPYLGIRWVLGPGHWGHLEPDHSGQVTEKWQQAKAKGEKFPADPFEWCRYRADGQEKLWETYFFCNGLGSCCLPNKWQVPPYKPETYDIGRAVLSAAGEKQFENYCRELGRAMAESYPDRAEHLYEITWEPELFWKGTPADLVKYHEIAYAALHAADPKAVVVGPAIHVADDFHYTLQLFKAGLGKYIDIFSLHYSYIGEGFERRNPAGRIRELKRLIKEQAGRDIPLMNTEFGMNTEFADGEAQLRSTQQEIRANLISLGEGFKHIIAFYITAAGGGYFYNLNPQMGCGTDKTGPRPLAPAYATLTWLLEGHKGVEAIEWLGETSMGYAYESPDDVTLALWDYGDQPNSVVIPLGVEQAKVYDLMGNLTVRPTENGALSLDLTNDPVYIQGVSPRLWGAKALKALKLAQPEIKLFPGDDGQFTGSVSAVFGRPLQGSLNLKAAEGLQLTTPEIKLDLPAGGTQEVTGKLKVSGQLAAGTYPISLILREGGVVVAAIGCVVRVSNPLKMGRIKPGFEADGRKSLRFTLQDLRGRPCTGVVKLRLLGVPESAQELPFSLAANETRELVATYADLAVRPERKYDVAAEVRLGEDYTFAYTEKTNFLAAPHLTPALDGKAGEWKGVPLVELKGVENCPRSPKYYSGDSARIGYAWDEAALYLRVEVTDNVFMQEQTNDRIWLDDGLQCGFCLEPWKEFEATADAFADSFRRPKQTEINFALTPEGPAAYRGMMIPQNDKLPCGRLTDQDLKLKIVRQGEVTIYEAAFPWKTLGLDQAPAAGEQIAVTVAVNDRDSRQQSDPSALSLYNGATGKKDRVLMGLLYLAK